MMTPAVIAAVLLAALARGSGEAQSDEGRARHPLLVPVRAGLEHVGARLIDNLSARTLGPAGLCRE